MDNNFNGQPNLNNGQLNLNNGQSNNTFESSFGNAGNTQQFYQTNGQNNSQYITPKKNHGVLIAVAIIAILLLLCCCCVGGIIIVASNSENGSVSVSNSISKKHAPTSSEFIEYAIDNNYDIYTNDASNTYNSFYNDDYSINFSFYDYTDFDEDFMKDRLKQELEIYEYNDATEKKELSGNNYTQCKFYSDNQYMNICLVDGILIEGTSYQGECRDEIDDIMEELID